MQFLSHPASTKLRSLINGASVVEYGILAGLISVAAIGAISQLGYEVEDTGDRVQSRVPAYH